MDWSLQLTRSTQCSCFIPIGQLQDRGVQSSRQPDQPVQPIPTQLKIVDS